MSTHFYYPRRRFGLFRRFFWFGLGIAAANMYWHKKEEERGFGRACANRRLPAGPVPASAPVAGAPVDHEKPFGDEKRWDWQQRAAAVVAAAKGEPTPSAPASPMSKSDMDAELQRIRSAAEDLWAQHGAQAEEYTREFAKTQLSRLSVALERIRDALDKGDGKPRQV